MDSFDLCTKNEILASLLKKKQKEKVPQPKLMTSHALASSILLFYYAILELV